MLLIPQRRKLTAVGYSMFTLAGTQRLRLEGDWDRHFALYVPNDYERDALYVITPDLMALLIDNLPGAYIETWDDNVAITAPGPLDFADPATWPRISRLIERRASEDAAPDAQLPRRAQRGRRRSRTQGTGAAGRACRSHRRSVPWRSSRRSCCWRCADVVPSRQDHVHGHRRARRPVEPRAAAGAGRTHLRRRPAGRDGAGRRTARQASGCWSRFGHGRRLGPGGGLRLERLGCRGAVQRAAHRAVHHPSCGRGRLDRLDHRRAGGRLQHPAGASARAEETGHSRGWCSSMRTATSGTRTWTRRPAKSSRSRPGAGGMR